MHQDKDIDSSMGQTPHSLYSKTKTFCMQVLFSFCLLWLFSLSCCLGQKTSSLSCCCRCLLLQRANFLRRQFWMKFFTHARLNRYRLKFSCMPPLLSEPMYPFSSFCLQVSNFTELNDVRYYSLLSGLSSCSLLKWLTRQACNLTVLAKTSKTSLA